MTVFYHLTKNEVRRLMHSPATYLALLIAITLMGFFYFLTLLAASTQPQELAPPTLFISLFWIPVLLVVPMLTMRSFAEEKRLGTIETVLTTKVSPTGLVCAKFIAAYVFYLLVWILALAYPFIAASVGSDPQLKSALFETGPLLGGYAFIALSGTFFVSIGIFSSSLTRSQLVAGMLSFSILFMIIVGITAIQFLNIDLTPGLSLSAAVLTYFQIFDHFEDFTRGLLDSRPVVYYLTGTAGILGLSILLIDAKHG